MNMNTTAVSLYPDRVLLLLAAGTAALVLLTGVLAALILLLRARTSWRTRRQEQRTAAWKAAVLEALSEDRRPRTVWAQVGRRERLAFLHLLLRFSFLLTGESRERLQVLARPFLSDLRPLLHARRASRRATAVHALGTLGGAAHRHHLFDALQDSSPLVALTAARLLAQHGSPQDAIPLLDVLPRFEGWGNNLVASVLAPLGGTLTSALAARFADAAEPPHVRVYAAEALRWSGNTGSAIPYLAARSVLQEEQDVEVLAAALRLVRKIGRPEDLPIILPFLSDDHYVLRIHAVSALAALGGAAHVPLLLSALADPSHWVAVRAARGLGELKAVPALQRVAASEHPRAVLARQVLGEVAA